MLSSHARPDGDSIGSQLAMAYALRALGKDVVGRQRDAAPAPLMAFPGVPDIEIAPSGRRRRSTPRSSWSAATWRAPASRASIGSSSSTSITIPGNTGYGQINWFDASAAACGEMVFDLIGALGVPLSLEIATHVYLAILTDTGSFHYSSISPRTFDICREALEAGVDPVLVARNVYDSNNMGRLKLFGAVLSAMQIDATGRIAIVYLDHEMARAAGGTYEDTDGLINLPLTVKEIQAVVFFKQIEGDEYRVSMRSKGDIDIGAVAKEFGGGGHKNAAGCTVTRRHRRAAEDCSSRRSSRRSMDGLLVIDKPAGPTSHDVVARVRRALGERRIGHTGTLDPAASGVLPLVLGRATRLARFLSAGDKSYDAVDPARRRRPTPYDARRRAGRRRGTTARCRRATRSTPRSTRFRGTFLQQPPAFSAKKIDGHAQLHAGARAAA